MKRKIYDNLLKWKKDKQGSTALLIEGARRIGKSYIAEEFARNEKDVEIKDGLVYLPLYMTPLL